MMQIPLKCTCNLNRILSPRKHLFDLIKYSSTNRNDNDGRAKKSPPIQKITVALEKKTLLMTPLEAQKLAKRRKLNLIVEEDPKTKRPLYKLIGITEMLPGNELPQTDELGKSKIKPEKHLTIGSRISDHDLSSRLKNITKWLNKQHEIRVLLQCTADDVQNGDKIYKTIEQSISVPDVLGKIVNKHTKGSAIKFTIIPTTSTPKEGI